MTMTESIPIYIGCTESQELIAKVLAWSVKRRTRRHVDCYSLYAHAIDYDMPKKPENRPGTPFSFHRFMIPEIAGYTGRAIYMDCDQIVFKDVARLYDRNMHGAPLLCCDTRRKGKSKPSKRSSMMLLDCAALDWKLSRIIADLDAGRYSYHDLFSLEHYAHTLPRRWNALDQYWPAWTALLHLTAKDRQPWIHYRHQLGGLWIKELFSAIDNGFIETAEVHAAVAAELVRPSLAYQLEQRLVDPRRLPDKIKAKDQPFIDACAARNFNNVPGEYRVSAT